MPRLLIVLPNLEHGGAEHTMVQLADGLAPEFDTRFAVVRDHGRLRDRLGHPVHDLGGRLALFASLPWLVWRLRPNAVVSTIWDLNLLVIGLRALFPRGTRVVVRESVQPEAITDRPAWWRLATGLHARLYRRADAIVAPAATIRDRLASQCGIGAYRIHLVYNGVPPARMSAPADAPQPTATAAPRFLAIGRLVHQKAYDVLLPAFARARQALPGASLTLVGDGPERPRLEQQARDLGVADAVHFAGWQPDPRPALSAADVFVLCSRYEGLPNSVLEALCSGVPVVATTAHTGAADVVRDGIDGLLVREAGADALAAALVRGAAALPTLDRPAIAHAARARFGLERYLAEMRAVLRAQPVPGPGG